MRRARQAPKELKALGKHPESGEPVRVLDGRYGPYVTDGTTNASVPKGTLVDALTMAGAVELLKAREGMGGSKKARGRGQAQARQGRTQEKSRGEEEARRHRLR